MRQTSKYYSFWELISSIELKNGIEVPMIQRDYAQGRNTKKISEIRDEFLNDLLNKGEAILLDSTKQPIELDFIYGSIADNKFIPLDGQQRLTTLFLIHWYLAIRDNELQNNSSILSRFTYQTRTSSRDFCQRLTDGKLEANNWNEIFQNDDNSTKISSIIENQNWYHLSWNHDPTVKSMLVMLDEIHKKFRHTEMCFNDLIDNQKKVIKFNYLPIDTFGRSDALYIKMNARGKVLTDFENFKAKFENFLRENNADKALLERFIKSIDGTWCDLFWDYIKADNQKEEFSKYDLVDKPMLNFIYFISEILYYKGDSNDKELFNPTFDTIKTVYQSDKNIAFLLDSFDAFSLLGGKSEQKENIHLFFNNNLSFKAQEDRRVNMFGSPVNLFKACIYREQFDVREKLLLYAVILYLYKSQIQEVEINENFQDYFRICRNFTLNIRQNNKHKYNSDLREKNIGSIVFFFEDIVSATNVYSTLATNTTNFPYKQDLANHEIEKAKLIVDSNAVELKETMQKLEDNVVLVGNLTNLMLLLNAPDYKSSAKLFENVWALREKNNSLLCRAFLSNGDYFEDIGNSNLGTQIYFGSEERWNRILTSGTAGKSQIISDFINHIKQFQDEEIEDRLNSLISSNLASKTFDEWKLLFIKHSCILSSRWNIFSFRWDNWNDYRVERFTGTTLSAWHNNAYIHAVIQGVDRNIVDEDGSYERNSEIGKLKLKNGTIMSLESDSWHVDSENKLLTADLKKSFNITHIDDKVLELKRSGNEDIVEVAIRFINKIFDHE